MEKFEIGQKVKVVNNKYAQEHGLDRLGMVGMEFIVSKLVPWYAIVERHEGDDGWYVPAPACELLEDVKKLPEKRTTFERVSEMNIAFGNPKGDFSNPKWDKVRSQYKNIFDEYCEGLIALGVREVDIEQLKLAHKELLRISNTRLNEPDVEGIRDALCDISVFATGAQHILGVDGDADMDAVVDGVMTRFIKDDEDKAATIALHASKGVSDVYFEGEYPKMVMKSAVDQPDAPKGKFLKSASYTNTVFRPAP